MDLEIRKRLKLDLQERNGTAALFLIVWGGIFWHFSASLERHQLILRVLSVSVSLVNLARFLLISRRRGGPSLALSRKLWILVAINCVMLFVIYMLLMLGLGVDHKLYVPIVFTDVGISVAGTVSLASSRSLQTLFTFANGLPIILANIASSPSHWIEMPTSYLAIMMLVYCLRQGRENRDHLIKLIRTELALEKANSELEASREQILRDTTRALQNSRLSALGEVAGGVAHEVNNPLTVILGRSRKIVNWVDRGQVPGSELRQVALAIEAMGLRIAKIIQGLKAIARDGSRDPMESYSLKSLIEEVGELCVIRFANAGIRFECIGLEGIDIWCRSTEIKQVILNLLNNSLDAVRSLSEKWIRVEARVTPEFLEIFLTDSGHGILPEVRERVMEPFFTTKEAGHGSGLGLSISKKILEAHGGSLAVDTLCENTRFVMRIPVGAQRVDVNYSRAS